MVTGTIVVLRFISFRLLRRNHFEGTINAFVIWEVFLTAIRAYQEKAVFFVFWMPTNLKYIGSKEFEDQKVETIGYKAITTNEISLEVHICVIGREKLVWGGLQPTLAPASAKAIEVRHIKKRWSGMVLVLAYLVDIFLLWLLAQLHQKITHVNINEVDKSNNYNFLCEGPKTLAKHTCIDPREIIPENIWIVNARNWRAWWNICSLQEKYKKAYH